MFPTTNMTIPTIQQYKEVLTRLYPKQLEVLQALYYCPNATATAKHLAQKINPSNPAPFASASILGRAAKRISDLRGTELSAANEHEPRMETYIAFVSHPYKPDIGWTMHKNLQIALEELHLVSKM